jgi:RluA family pseudouridine synthase
MIFSFAQRILAPEAESEQSLRMKPPPMLDVLFEDEVLLALNKPAGLLLAPDPRDKNEDSLMQRVHGQLNPEAHCVHHVDKHTSGLVLCVKQPEAWKRLSGWFASPKVVRRYLCLTRGVPAEQAFTLELPLAPNPQGQGRMMVAKHGRTARAAFQILEVFKNYALVEARPETGRHHQIRVLLASKGTPLLADPFYGDGKPLLLSTLKRSFKIPREGERPLIARPALHSAALEFPHPVTELPVKLEAPLPKDFAIALKYLRKFTGR